MLLRLRRTQRLTLRRAEAGERRRVQGSKTRCCRGIGETAPNPCAGPEPEKGALRPAWGFPTGGEIRGRRPGSSLKWNETRRRPAFFDRLFWQRGGRNNASKPGPGRL